jgi:hypothetical protein
MAVRQTKRYRELSLSRERLLEYVSNPVIRHFVYMIEHALDKMDELEELKKRLIEVDDRIFCAQAFLSFLKENKEAEVRK